MSSQTLSVRIRSVTWEAPAIHSYDLRPVEGGELPPFTAGAHVDLFLPNGMVRSYSLSNDQAERHRYVVAVQKDRKSRGGSQTVHDRLRPGDVIQIGAPRNNFELQEAAGRTVLFAGGIGITPILAMARRLVTLGRPWVLHYSARTREQAAFLDELAALAARPGGALHLNFDEAPGGRMLDLASIIRDIDPAAHLYCCGPTPMLDAFLAAGSHRDPATMHVEYFTAKEAPATTGGFTVVLARSGLTVQVAEGQTILDAVHAAGVDSPCSCLEGVCGSCETTVLEGEPDHRDLILTDAERAANKSMMICCSGAKSAKLVLDL